MERQATLQLFPSSAAPRERRRFLEPVKPERVELRRLRRAVRRGHRVSLETVDVPWEPDGPDELTALGDLADCELTIVTRSSKLVDQLGLLVDLDWRCTVTVDMLLASLDPFLVRRLEPGAEDPRARLRAVATLASEGLAVRLICAPWRPGLNDREPGLRALLSAARQAGAQDVAASLAEARSSRFFRRLSGRALEEAEKGLADFRRLRLEYGFPRPVAGRG